MIIDFEDSQEYVFSPIVESLRLLHSENDEIDIHHSNCQMCIYGMEEIRKIAIK